MVMQVRNNEMVDILRADFQARYEPNFAWKSAASALLGLPGLRGAWSAAVVGAVGELNDISGHGGHLALNGNPTFRYLTSGLIAWCEYDGTGDYHSIPDNARYDIIGNETYINSAVRGLTIGGWFRPTETGTLERLMCKWTAGAGNRSYTLNYTVGDAFQFTISNDGTNTFTVTSTAITPVNNWYCVFGRFLSATPELNIYVGQASGWTAITNAVGIPATIFNSNANFVVAANSGGTEEFQGRISHLDLCVEAAAEGILKAFFNQTRAGFGI